MARQSFKIPSIVKMYVGYSRPVGQSSMLQCYRKTLIDYPGSQIIKSWLVFAWTGRHWVGDPDQDDMGKKG